MRARWSNRIRPRRRHRFPDRRRPGGSTSVPCDLCPARPRRVHLPGGHPKYPDLPRSRAQHTSPATHPAVCSRERHARPTSCAPRHQPAGLTKPHRFPPLPHPQPHSQPRRPRLVFFLLLLLLYPTTDSLHSTLLVARSIFLRSMKVLCSACEAAEARVVCCADEAALCARCDRDVHAANRLAGKHHRLPLLSHSSPAAAAVSAPNCDICQEGHAYFFCVEDRALLCRSCDVAVHTANAFVSAHRRFLLTGVQVGLEPDDQEPEPEPEPEPLIKPANTNPLQPPPCHNKKRSPTPPLYSDGEIDWPAGPDVGITGSLPDWSVIDDQFGGGSQSPPELRPSEPALIKAPPKKICRGAVTTASAALFGGSMPDWPLDEFFGFAEFNSGFGFADNGTSKADSGKHGSPNRRSMSSSSSGAATQSAQEYFGQVPEVHWSSVPELPSPPTASGLHWQDEPHYGSSDTAAFFVPDICSPGNPYRSFAAIGSDPQLKRRRRC